jgi:hypothetical protein
MMTERPQQYLKKLPSSDEDTFEMMRTTSYIVAAAFPLFFNFLHENQEVIMARGRVTRKVEEARRAALAAMR